MRFVIDSHVHIRNCFDLDSLFDSASHNFETAAQERALADDCVIHVLLLTEGNEENWFAQISTKMEETGLREVSVAAGWNAVKITASTFLLKAKDSRKKLYLVKGKQLVTKEKIEVLALYCDETISDGLSLAATVAAVEKAGAIAVLPWGVGKWLGTRGRAVRQFITENKAKALYLGDNGGRPRFWPTPSIIKIAAKKGMMVLPGSDPLPLPGEERRIGSFGFMFEGDPHQEDPIQYLKSRLLAGDFTMMPYGRLQQNHRFFLNQIRLQLSR